MTDPSGPDAGGPHDPDGLPQRRSPWDPPDVSPERRVAPLPPVWDAQAGPGHVPLPPAPPPDPAAGAAQTPFESDGALSAWDAAAAGLARPTGSVPVGGGGGAASTAEPIRGVRGQRYGGPRYSAKMIFSVLGLLGLLITVAIMAILSGRVMGDLGGGDRSVDDALHLSSTTTTPGAPPVTSADPGAAGPGSAGTGPVAAGEAQACATNIRTVETAAQAYEAMNGSYPPDVATLIGAGLLVPPERPLNVELHVVAGTPEVVGTGPCASR